jgi:membrane protein YdbS with pleckstrin-like domain
LSYASKHLIPGEALVYETRLHWVTLIWHSFLAIVFLATPAVLLFIYYRDREYVELISGILLLVAIIVIWAGMIRRSATEMAVTTKRVLIKQGIFGRRTLELLLQKVESITVEEPMMGRMFGYGTVVIRGTGGTPEPFDRIASPLVFRRQVEQQIAALTP